MINGHAPSCLQAKSKSKPEMTAAEKGAECQLVEQVTLVLAA